MHAPYSLLQASLGMIIFLSGPDTFRSRQKLKQIRERFRREVDKTGYNTTTLGGRGLNVETFEQALLAAPFLAPKRLVVVEELLAAKPNAATEEQLLEVLQRPAADQSVAVFWENELPTGKGGALLKFLRQSPYAEQFDRMSGPALIQWYRRQAEHHELVLEPPALERLVELVGDDLWRADGELQKLAAYCRQRPATVDDAAALVASDVEENIFALTDAIGQCRPVEALQLLQRQHRAGVSPLELVAKMAWHGRNLLQAKAWLNTHGRAGGSWELAEALQVHPFVAKKVLGQVGNFSLAALIERYRRLLQLDYRLKNGHRSGAALLALLVVESTAVGKPSGR